LSRLTDLIAKAKGKDLQLGADLDREFRVLSSRLPFGLNFERHSPEVVELPMRPVRKGDKVRQLPLRGSTKNNDQQLWRVKAISRTNKTADLELLDPSRPEIETVALDDLVVVVASRDTIYPGLVSTGTVERGGDKPCHTVINGENYRRAARIFTPDISRTYVDHLAGKVANREEAPEQFLEAIAESRVTVAGLALVMEVQAYFDAAAEELAKTWLTYHITSKLLGTIERE